MTDRSGLLVIVVGAVVVGGLLLLVARAIDRAEKTMFSPTRRAGSPPCRRSACVDGWIYTFSSSGGRTKIRCSCGRAG